MSKIGLLGGTFDPIHTGHVLLGRWAMEFAALDEVWFVPANVPWMKRERHILPAHERLRMTRLAVEGQRGFQVCTVELDAPGDSATAETLRKLSANHPEHRFYTILGADCLEQLERWREPEQILARSDLIAAARAGSEMDALSARARALERRLGGRIMVMPFLNLDFSSTLVRQRARDGLSIHLLVPEAVEAYILSHGFYRAKAEKE